MLQRRSARRPGLAACLILLSLALGLFSCAGRFKLESQSLLSFREIASTGTDASAKTDGLVLNLSRDNQSVFGSWEDPAKERYGLVEGDAKADASLSLKLYGASTGLPVGSFKGKYSGGEERIEGALAFAGETGRPLVLAVDEAATEGLSVQAIHATTRENLDKDESEPSRFIFVGFEPSTPAVFKDAYRASFQGGKALKDIIAQERDGFLGDFKSVSGDLKAKAANADVRPWYYEGRQILSYRSNGLFVMALRRGIYTGTTPDISQALRYAVIDEATGKTLSPSDFLAAGWEEKLPAILADSLREELGFAPGSSLKEQGLPGELPSPSPDFLVYSRGLGFHYPAGVLLKEETGDVFILVPFSRIGGLLKSEAMAAYGLAGARK